MLKCIVRAKRVKLDMVAGEGLTWLVKLGSMAFIVFKATLPYRFM